MKQQKDKTTKTTSLIISRYIFMKSMFQIHIVKLKGLTVFTAPSILSIFFCIYCRFLNQSSGAVTLDFHVFCRGSIKFILLYNTCSALSVHHFFFLISLFEWRIIRLEKAQFIVLGEFSCICNRKESGIKPFVSPKEAACNWINYSQWCHPVAKLHCG